MAAIKDDGEVIDPRRIDCRDTAAIVKAVEDIKPFRAVIEATGTYRWLHDLLSPHGSVLLAHPLRLRAMIQRRAKTDKLDAQLLASLLRINQIPLAYIPPKNYQQLRDLVRCRARLARGAAKAKIQLRMLLARENREATVTTARLLTRVRPGFAACWWKWRCTRCATTRRCGTSTSGFANAPAPRSPGWRRLANWRKSVGSAFVAGTHNTGGKRPKTKITCDAHALRR